MSYSTCTLISGYDTIDRPPASTRTQGIDNDMEILAFGEKHRKSFALKGHWKPETALRYARRHGIRGNVEIEHHVSDTNGKGRGGLDARFIGIGDTVTPVVVTPEEDAAYAAVDHADFWSA
jgi:hypothetical protein